MNPEYNICLDCWHEFKPKRPHYTLCPDCFQKMMDAKARANHPTVNPSDHEWRGWDNYWDWRIFGLAPHLNFDNWSNEFEVEFYRLCWRDE